jgi:hypothetical protein
MSFMKASNRSHRQHNDNIGFHLKNAATPSNQWGPLHAHSGTSGEWNFDLVARYLDYMANNDVYPRLIVTGVTNVNRDHDHSNNAPPRSRCKLVRN